MTRGYVLTALAEADLRDLIRYSREQSGEQRTRAYVTELEDGTRRLALKRFPESVLSCS